jgi:gliding motility-associated-like protein
MSGGGNLNIDMSSNPSVDIDFICWGPFTDCSNMCSLVNSAAIEDCSYSANNTETCNITGAVAGEIYLLMITNYSNQSTNISFSQTSGNATTNPCVFGGPAGNDSIINKCLLDSPFLLTDQLAGNHISGGTWYNPLLNVVSNSTFDPSNDIIGTYTYIVDSTSCCPNDTSYLDILLNSNPTTNFPVINSQCSSETEIILNTAIPFGGTYSGTSVTDSIFIPNFVGLNSINYVFIDSNNCSDTSTQNFVIYDTPVISSNIVNVSCYGFSDGIINTIISGGTAPFTENWGGYNPLTLNAGSYSYMLTDDNNCTANDTINVYEPPEYLTNVISNNIDCNGNNNGSALINIQITSYPSSYGNISELAYCNSFPGANTFSNIKDVQLIGDNYNINNNTAGLCDSYEDYTSQYADLTQGQSYSVVVSLSDCNGYNFPSGGYVYIDWNVDGDFLDPGEEIGSIPFGDSIVNAAVVIPFTVPNSLSYGPTRLRVMSQFSSLSSITSMSSCDQGVYSPSTTTYSEPWYGATEDYSLTIYPDTTNQTFLWSTLETNDSINNLNAGIYTVITSSNGCSYTDSIEITEPPVLSVSTIITNVSCNGGNNGSITFNINGGTMNYEINIDGVNQNLAAGLTSFTTPSNLSAGSYPYTISDANGCLFIDTAYVLESIAISLVENTTSVSCFGGSNGSIDLSISGGTGSFNFTWSTADTTEDISNLSIGTYTYTITDSLNCIFSDTVSITEPSPINVSISINNVSCANGNDGIAILNISGGVFPYTENWGLSSSLNLEAGNHTFIVTDDNGCNYSDSITISEPSPLLVSYSTTDALCNGALDGTATLTISGGVNPYSENWGLSNPIALNAGSHTFIVADTNGCTKVDSFIISEPSQISVLVDTFRVSCAGFSDGSASLNISGGTAPYIQDWGVNNPLALDTGTFLFTVTDSNNCLYQGQAIITEPNPIIVNELTTEVSCFGLSDGVVLLQINGGTAPYNEDWGGNNPLALSQGNYSYTITDINGCVQTNYISINQPNELLVTSTVVDVSCFGSSDGSIYLNINGGTAPYTENWVANNPLLLSAGTYNFIVTDSKGCQFNDDIIVNQPDKIIANYSVESPICRNDASTISLNIINPTVNQYTIEINNQTNTVSYIIDTLGNIITENSSIILYPEQTIDAVLVSITDIYGCKSIINQANTIIVDQLPVLNMILNDVCESNPSFILNQATPQGGAYYINDELVNIFDIENLETGDYIVSYQYTDPVTSCNNAIQKIISILPSPTASFISTPQPTDLDNPDIRFINTSEDFTNIIWDLGDNNTEEDRQDFIHTYSDTGTYITQLIIINQYNCRDTINGSLRINPVYRIYIPTSFTPNSDGMNEVFEPIISGAKSYTMKIYDRWGGIIYQGDNQAWDGKNTAKGLYSYSIEIIDYKNKIDRQVGQVTLGK